MFPRASRSSPVLTAALAAFPIVQTTTIAPRPAAVIPHTQLVHEASTRVWGDADGDSLVDLYVVNPAGEDRLFRNRGDGTFEDVTLRAGLAGRTDTETARWEDFDRDQRLDLVLVTSPGGLLLYRGEGGGSFREVGAELGLADPGIVRSADWLDYDRDGWLDLAVVAEGRGPIFFHANGGRGFERVELALPAAKTDVVDGSKLDPTRVPRSDARDATGAAATGRSTERGAIGRTTDRGASLGRRDVPGASGSRPARSGGPPSTEQAITTPILQRTPSSTEPPSDPPPTCVVDGPSGNCIPVSTSPQFGTLYPLGNELWIDPSGDVSIGVPPGSAVELGATSRRLHVRTADPQGLAVFGESVAVSGTTDAIRGRSASPAGRGVSGEAPAEGVRGDATATSGVARGMRGTSLSSEGEGVLGEAAASSGDNVGVRGTSASPEGRGVGGSAPAEGVRGDATATIGVARGMRGTSLSSEGEGVLGEATALLGDNVGVRGTSNSPNGRGVVGAAPAEGVRGDASAPFGVARGVRGTSSSMDGEGVLGEVTAMGGNTVGVRGTSASLSGRGVVGSAPAEGVRGDATFASGPARGVRGTSVSVQGEGVLGEATASSGLTVGVRGTTASASGSGVEGLGPAEGVHGRATSPVSNAVGVRGTVDRGIGVLGESPYGGGDPAGTTGVHGQSAARFGRGVVGVASHMAGEGHGVEGKSASSERQSSGVLAEGNGAMGLGNPRAAALEIANGAIVVSGIERPAGSIDFSGPWSPIKGCGPSQPTIGHYTDVFLQNALILPDSLVLVTVDTGSSPQVERACFAQVYSVGPGVAQIRVSVIGDPGSPVCDLPEPMEQRVNYLIINQEP